MPEERAPLVAGERIRVFHPQTFGTMEWCRVLKIVDDRTAKVQFDRPNWKGRTVYVVDTEHFIRR